MAEGNNLCECVADAALRPMSAPPSLEEDEMPTLAFISPDSSSCHASHVRTKREGEWAINVLLGEAALTDVGLSLQAAPSASWP